MKGASSSAMPLATTRAPPTPTPTSHTPPSYHTLQVRFQEERLPFLAFITSVCAIVGGVFTVSQWKQRNLTGGM